MGLIIYWCRQQGIRLSPTQLRVVFPLNVINIYSHYPTKQGSMFYVRVKEGRGKKWFLHILYSGQYILEDGYDGGDLSKYTS